MTNPYEPPADLGFAPPPVKEAARPTAVTVFGIMNIIFASMGLLCLPLSIAILFIPQPPNAPSNPFLAQFSDNPGYMNFTLVLSVIGLIAAVVELVSGIGLLRMKPWGRTLALAYGVYSILAVVAQLAGSYAFLIAPTLERARQGNDPSLQGQAVGQVIGGVLGAVVGLVYPILLLIFLTRPGVVRAMGAARAAKPEVMDFP